MRNNLIKNKPKILLSTDRKSEILIILKFLNHPDFPNHRILILNALPELKQYITNNKNEKSAVKEFVNDFYIKNKSILNSINKDIKLEIKSSSKALEALSIAMGYKWKKNQNYIAKLSILPFSPFSKNIFYFSILDRINGFGKKNIIETAIHEISHFIFFEYLKKIEKNEGIILNNDIKYYLKEVLTAAVFNENPIRDIFKINNYKGNPDIRDIYIKDKKNNVETFIDYTRKKYINNRNNNNNFMVFLNSYVISLNKVSDEFSKKRKIWNKYGKQLIQNEIIFNKYKKFIKLV